MGGDSLIKVGTNVWAQALGILGVNFCHGIRFWEVNFAQVLDFWQFLTKEYVIFYKTSEKSGLLAETFQFWHSKVMKTYPVIRFHFFAWALGIKVSWPFFRSCPRLACPTDPPKIIWL